MEKVNSGLENVIITGNFNLIPKTIKTHYRNIVKKAGLNHIHNVYYQIAGMGIVPVWIAVNLFFGEDLLLLDLVTC